jgi:hypothetical protein
MKNHPEYKVKIKNGHNGYIYSNNPTWGKNNFCFYILDDDNNKIPISFNFTLLGDLKKREVFETCMLVLMSASYERGIGVVSKTISLDKIYFFT